MKLTLLGTAVLAGLSLAACNDTPTDPPDNPAAATMTYKQGARYEYESYSTDPTTNARTDTSARVRTWTLVNTSATVNGRSNVAVYIDSVFSTAGGFVNVTDSVLIQQQSGSNDIYRWASLFGELDFSASVPVLGSLDLGREWQHEARLNSTTGVWAGASISDTIPSPINIPAVTGFLVKLQDSAIASTSESLTIGPTSYPTTKSTHSLRLSISALVGAFGATVPIELTSTSITRVVWVAPSLGAIVKETREGKVVQAEYQGQSVSIPIPGYFSLMTRVIASGG
jgi:hypothetical protein